MYYVNMSMFFSFATLYPEMQVLLYGILPLKSSGWPGWTQPCSCLISSAT